MTRSRTASTSRRASAWPAGPIPPGTPRLRGSVPILRMLRAHYSPVGLPAGTLVALLLDPRSILLGQGRMRDLPVDLDTGLNIVDQTSLLVDIIGTLAADSRAAEAAACLLVAIRDGPDRHQDGDLHWWTALRAACAHHGLRAADVLVATPAGWFTLRAGTSGPGEWPGCESRPV